MLQYKTLPVWYDKLSERWQDFPEMLIETFCPYSMRLSIVNDANPDLNINWILLIKFPDGLD